MLIDNDWSHYITFPKIIQFPQNWMNTTNNTLTNTKGSIAMCCLLYVLLYERIVWSDSFSWIRIVLYGMAWKDGYEYYQNCVWKQKTTWINRWLITGEEGFEPPWTVLETVILATGWFPFMKVVGCLPTKETIHHIEKKSK